MGTFPSDSTACREVRLVSVRGSADRPVRALARVRSDAASVHRAGWARPPAVYIRTRRNVQFRRKADRLRIAIRRFVVRWHRAVAKGPARARPGRPGVMRGPHPRRGERWHPAAGRRQSQQTARQERFPSLRGAPPIACEEIASLPHASPPSDGCNSAPQYRERNGCASPPHGGTLVAIR